MAEVMQRLEIRESLFRRRRPRTELTLTTSMLSVARPQTDPIFGSTSNETTVRTTFPLRTVKVSVGTSFRYVKLFVLVVFFVLPALLAAIGSFATQGGTSIQLQLASMSVFLLAFGVWFGFIAFWPELLIRGELGGKLRLAVPYRDRSSVRSFVDAVNDAAATAPAVVTEQEPVQRSEATGALDVAGEMVAANLGPRALARLIDLVVIVSISAAIQVALGASDLSIELSNTRLLIVPAAIGVGYFALLEWSLGRTVGKILTGLKTEGPDREKPSFTMAIKRNIWYAVIAIPTAGSIAFLAAWISIAVTINKSLTNTGWHDTFAGGTRVISTR